MSGVLDFLFEGQPPKSVTTYGQTVKDVPTWLSDYTQGLISRANAISAEPYQTYGGPRVAPLSPLQTSAQNLAQNRVGAWSPYVSQAAGLYTGAANGAGALNQAAPYMGQASSALTQAGKSAPGNLDQYISPYVDNVVNRASDVATRAFNEKLMPGINSNFIRAGQFGSAKQQQSVGNAMRDVTENIQSQANAAYDQAYTRAGDMFNTDQSRLAQTGQALGALGQSAGALYGDDQTRKLQAGQGLGQLADTSSTLGGRDVSMLDAAGQEQQQQIQRNLDTAYGDFQQQRDYPRSTVDWMSSIVRGLPSNVTPQSTTTSQTGPANVYQPSPLSQVAGLYSTMQGLNTLQHRRGGMIRRRYKRGGMIRALPFKG